MVRRSKYFKATLIILLILFLSFIPMTVSALTFSCSCGEEHEVLSPIQTTDFLYTNIVYGGQLFSSVEGDVTGFDINAVLAFDIKNNGLFKTLWNEAERLYNIMLPIGELLAFVYYLLALMEKSLSDNFSAEQFARDTIKLAGMILILRMGFQLLTWGMELSSFVYKKLQQITSFRDNVSGCRYDECKNRNFFESIGHMLSLLIPWLLMSIARVVIRVICWSRVLTIIVRVIFAPIGMADSVKGGTSSQGFRYFKKIVASAMQGSLILGVSVAYNLIVSSISVDGSIGWVQPVVLAAVVITLVFKSSSMAEEMLGC